MFQNTHKHWGCSSIHLGHKLCEFNVRHSLHSGSPQRPVNTRKAFFFGFGVRGHKGPLQLIINGAWHCIVGLSVSDSECFFKGGLRWGIFWVIPLNAVPRGRCCSIWRLGLPDEDFSIIGRVRSSALYGGGTTIILTPERWHWLRERSGHRVEISSVVDINKGSSP